jgi:hypothetical protein
MPRPSLVPQTGFDEQVIDAADVEAALEQALTADGSKFLLAAGKR